jgi:hypothetical protein
MPPVSAAQVAVAAKTALTPTTTGTVTKPTFSEDTKRQILAEAAGTMLDQDPHLLVALSQKMGINLPEGVETRASLKAWAEQNEPTSLWQRLKGSMDGTYQAFRGREFWYWRWPGLATIAGMGVGAATGLPQVADMAANAQAGGLVGLGAALGSGVGLSLGGYLNYLIFWSRIYPSQARYDRYVETHNSNEDDGENFTCFASQAIGFLVGGAASVFALEAATGVLTQAPDASTLLPAVAIVAGAAALRYMDTAFEPVRQFFGLGAEVKRTRALHDLLAQAQSTSGEDYLAQNLDAALGFLERFIDDKVRMEITTVSADIEELDRQIAETHAHYDGLQWSRMSEEQSTRANAQKNEELASYQNQRGRLADQVLAQLNEGCTLGKLLARQMKIELGQKVPMETVTSDREYGLLVDQELELRRMKLKRSEDAFNVKAARVTALVEALKRVILQTHAAAETYRELKEAGIRNEY